MSFTNSAVEKFRIQCRRVGLDSALRHPSFMGTMDAFVRQFIVLPAHSAESPQAPLIIDSWETLGIEIRLAGRDSFRGDGVSLDAFDPETNSIDPNTIGHTGLRNHVHQHRARYEQAAANRRRGLMASGYLSAGDARAATLRLVRDTVRGQALGAALAARFSEIVVDEGQDCNPLDFEILRWLRGNGVEVSVVCDPDQAIYEFRHGNPATLMGFRQTFRPEAIHSLTGNFRSTVPICRLSATLRNSNDVDQPLGECATVPHPVILLSYKGQARDIIGRTFAEHVKAVAITLDQAVVLSHAAKNAYRAAGDVSARDAVGNSRVELFARCVAEYWAVSTSARSKESILQSVERMLLDLIGLREEREHVAKCFQRNGLSRRVYRRKALELIVGVPKTCPDTDAGRQAWVDAFHKRLDSLGLDLPSGQTVRGYFRCPREARWSDCLHIASGVNLAWSTIHEAKGHEYEAVCVVIPPNRAPHNRSEVLVSSWEGRTDDEAKRVLYVGVTRAMKLVVLAVPKPLADRCGALLVAGQVPHIRQDLDDAI